MVLDKTRFERLVTIRRLKGVFSKRVIFGKLEEMDFWPVAPRLDAQCFQAWTTVGFNR